ncbi:MAG: hypothetical protein J6O40_04945, partial [Ruminococcus sp.]|nr:hypothetical protein [Ruminococcus sp.]
MPPRFKPDANALAKEGKNMALSDIIDEIEKAANDDPQGMPEGYQGIVKSLKDLNSGMAGSVSNAINSLDSIDDWFIEKGPSGKTNFEELEKRIGSDKLRELILLLNAKLGLDLEPDSLRRGLKKLRELDGDVNAEADDMSDDGKEHTQENVNKKPVKTKEQELPPGVEVDIGDKGEYLPDKERNAARKFSTAIDIAAKGLTDRGLFGMRGSSKEHEALVNAYGDLRLSNAHIINEKDKKELALNNKLKALENLFKTADHYIAQKRREDKADVYDENWSPKTPMGVNRYEAAKRLREEAKKELMRINPSYRFESEIEKEQPEPEMTQPEPEQTISEAAEEKNVANILDDPENLYDRQGWVDKLESIPDKMPENPELAERLSNEMLKCTVAIGIIDQMNEQNVPEEERTAEKFLEMHENGNSVIRDMGFLKLSPSAKWGFAAVAREVAYHGKEYVENLSKEELLERGIDKDQIENELKALRNDSPENEVEEAQPEAEEMKDDPEMINVDDMIKEMRDIDLDAIKDPKEASEKVLGTAAKILNTNLMIMTGQSLTTMGEFNKSTEKL